MKSSLVDRRERFIAYDPRVVPWWEQWNVARLKDHFAAVVRDEKDACCESGVSRASFANGRSPDGSDHAPFDPLTGLSSTFTSLRYSLRKR